jgi:hypothetical protein
MGSEWGLSGDSDSSRSSRQPKTLQAIHRLAASKPPRATATSPQAAGSDNQAEIRVKASATVVTRTGRAIRTAPNPGTS